MRNMLAFLAFLLLGFLGLGWYLDWYRIDKISTGSGRSSFQIEIDRNKIGEDSRKILKQGSEKIQEALDEHKKAADTDSRAKTNMGLDRPGEEEAEPHTGLLKTPR